MKKPVISIALATATCIMSVPAVSAAEPIAPPEPPVWADPLTYIEIASPPGNTTYYRGEELNLYGLKVDVYQYSSTVENNEVQYIPQKIYSAVTPMDLPELLTVDTSAFDTDVPGTYTIKVGMNDNLEGRWWDGETADFTVIVREEKLSEMIHVEPMTYLKLTSYPDKMEFPVGAPLDLSGLRMDVYRLPGGYISVSEAEIPRKVAENVDPVKNPELYTVETDYDPEKPGAYTVSVGMTMADDNGRWWNWQCLEFSVFVTDQPTFDELLSLDEGEPDEAPSENPDISGNISVLMKPERFGKGDDVLTADSPVKLPLNTLYTYDTKRMVTELRLPERYYTADVRGFVVCEEDGGYVKLVKLDLSVKPEYADTDISTRLRQLMRIRCAQCSEMYRICDPGETVTDPSGDVNWDGMFTVADVVALQKWLICAPGAELMNWQNADLCTDGRLDVYDLCAMKRKLAGLEDVTPPGMPRIIDETGEVPVEYKTMLWENLSRKWSGTDLGDFTLVYEPEHRLSNQMDTVFSVHYKGIHCMSNGELNTNSCIYVAVQDGNWVRSNFMVPPERYAEADIYEDTIGTDELRKKYDFRDSEQVLYISWHEDDPKPTLAYRLIINDDLEYIVDFRTGERIDVITYIVP